MTETTFISLLMAVACCGGCVLAEAPATHGPDELQALVKQLGSQDFDERDDAKSRLAGLGEAAREVLTKALNDADPEIAASAAVLLEKMNRAVLAVRVVDSAEKPLSEVPVLFDLWCSDGRRTVSVLSDKMVNTDANGWACVGDLKPGGGYHLKVSCQTPGYVPAAIGQQEIELKVQRHEFKLVALRCATVTGTLLDKAQAPLTNCRLGLVPANRVHALMATTNEHGQFKFEQVDPGEYAFALVGDGGLLWRSDTIQFKGEETLEMGILVTAVDPAALKQDDDVVKDDEENAALLK